MESIGLPPILPPERELSFFAPPFPSLDDAISKPSCFELFSEVAVKVTDLLTVRECSWSSWIFCTIFSRASKESICSKGIREHLFTAEKHQCRGHVACRRSTLKLLANVRKKWVLIPLLRCVSYLCLCLLWVRCLDFDPFNCKQSFTEGEGKKRKRGKLSLCSGSNLYASIRLTSAVVHTACTLYREHCWKEVNVMKPGDASFNLYFWLHDTYPNKRAGNCEPAFCSIPACSRVLLLQAEVHTGERGWREGQIAVPSGTVFLRVLCLLPLGWLLRAALKQRVQTCLNMSSFR